MAISPKNQRYFKDRPCRTDRIQLCFVNTVDIASLLYVRLVHSPAVFRVSSEFVMNLGTKWKPLSDALLWCSLSILNWNFTLNVMRSKLLIRKEPCSEKTGTILYIQIRVRGILQLGGRRWKVRQGGDKGVIKVFFSAAEIYN